ncbi:MAG: hypothetical protein DRJ07_00175 [Bacteroidetes bacterium]|nr:MAG: hypothetical protein DRJ07_00175 [Bacteroidota bacterium]
MIIMKERNKIYQAKIVMLFIAFLLTSNFGIAQDEDTDKKPVRSPWTTNILIDNQTTIGPNAKTFDFTIHHRFGAIKEMSDLFGIYAASNIRLGINYGITKKISIGFGTEKYNKMQEFQGKYQIISQTRDGKIPVAVTYFGNVVIDARDKEVFGKNYEFSNRLSYFNQIIVSRKFTGKLSMQFAASYSHFNAVDSLWKNDYIGLMLGGRYKIVNKVSAIFEYCHPFAVNEAWEGQNEPLPNLGLGVEFGTSTHAFQVFAAQYDNIIAQKNYANNLNDMGDGGWRFGFNITARF